MNGKSKIFEEIIDKMMLEYFDEDFKNKICNLSVDKKRMMILCLLDKDRNLFMKAKEKIQDNKTKLKHIKDLVLILREYVHVGEVEKKKHGEVMTPLELVKEMLATLPEEVWTNPNLKWLDSCNGTGPFLAMVVYKLMMGLKEWQPDEEKRYKHILENMIYAGELQAKNMFLWLTLMDIYDEYNMNIYCGSFLDADFDKHMKNVWKIDKFDVVVGNPPYNSGNTKNFYIDFFDQSFRYLKHDGYMTFITPSRYVIQPEYTNFRKNVENISKKVILFNKGRAFGEAAAFSVVVTTIYFGKGCKVNWVDGIGDNIVNKVLNSKFDRLNTNRSKAIVKTKEERDSYFDYENVDNIYKYFVNSCGNRNTPFRYLNVYIKDTFRPKLVCTEFVGTGKYKTLGNPIIDENGDFGIASDTTMYIYSDNIEKLNKLNIYFKSKLMDYILTIICQSSHANQTMKLLPDISDKINNEEDIYTLFNFTKEEIDIIKNKKY